jgi:hypothetical protein
MDRCMKTLLVLPLLLSAGVAWADDEPDTPPPAKPGEPKMVGGMSVVGNDEAPKSLVIVPWKSSELGGALDLSFTAQLGPQPVDREVFRRSLNYYEIRVGGEAASEGRQ